MSLPTITNEGMLVTLLERMLSDLCTERESCITEVPDEILKKHYRELRNLSQDGSFRSQTRPDNTQPSVMDRLLSSSTIIAMDYLIVEMKRRDIW